jgi:hypothetical protein
VREDRFLDPRSQDVVVEGDERAGSTSGAHPRAHGDAANGQRRDDLASRQGGDVPNLDRGKVRLRRWCGGRRGHGGAPW